MNKMRRTVALFIAMLMLFSCVQGGVFTAMAVDDASDEQSAVEEVSVAEEPSEPSEADDVGSEQLNESDEGSQEDVASEEEVDLDMKIIYEDLIANIKHGEMLEFFFVTADYDVMETCNPPCILLTMLRPSK